MEPQLCLRVLLNVDPRARNIWEAALATHHVYPSYIIGLSQEYVNSDAVDCPLHF